MVIPIRRVTLEEIVPLRHEILRQGLPRDTAIFQGDQDETARHYGAFDKKVLIGCVTLHPSRWEGQPAWQLRGMAVTDGWQGRGIGRRLLAYLEEDITDAPVGLLWCNARVPAVGFYEKLGWQVVSEVFDIPTAGPHMKMIRRLARKT